MDFSAPDKARDRAPTAAEIAQKIASAEARALSRRFRSRRSARQRPKATAARRWRSRRSRSRIQGIAARFSGIETRMETEAVEVAVAVARKLCSELIAARAARRDRRRSCSDCFSHLVSTPHLVVRINDGLYEAARERIERLAKQSGFDGRLVILAEPDVDERRLQDRVGRWRRRAGARGDRSQDQ